MSLLAAACFIAVARFIRRLRRHSNGRTPKGNYLFAVFVAVVFISTARAQQQPEHLANRRQPDALLDESGDTSRPGLPNKTSLTSLTDSTAHRPDGEEKEDEGDEDEDENRITSIVEELFLGIVVYPQEKNEVQLTFGYFDGVESAKNSVTIFEIEYGITDRFQIGFEVPTASVDEDVPFNGVRDLGLDLYYNFYNDRRTGRAYGAGLEFGVPVDSAAGESRVFEYSPYFVAYQEYRDFALNVSAVLSVEDALKAEESTETSGNVDIGLIRKAERIVPLLELDVEIASEETPVRIAPGLYYRSLLGPLDVAVSFPIGLNHDAPDFAAYFLAVVEFDADAIRPRFFK